VTVPATAPPVDGALPADWRPAAGPAAERELRRRQGAVLGQEINARRGCGARGRIDRVTDLCCFRVSTLALWLCAIVTIDVIITVFLCGIRGSG